MCKFIHVFYSIINKSTIDDFRGACAFKGNGAVAGHVKRVDHDDVFDALLFREETLTRHYFKLKFDFSWGIRTNMGKTEGIFLNLQCNCHIVGSIRGRSQLSTFMKAYTAYAFL